MKQSKKKKPHLGFAWVAFTCFIVGCMPSDQRLSVAEAMDGIVTRLYAQFDTHQLDTIGAAFILDFITDEEREALATTYWQFTVNVPVVVSLMRDSAQSILPFWLGPSGFKKTDLTVSNGSYTYEVWQKRFPAGLVELGVNGFDKHRPVYFISVKPQDPTSTLLIDPFFPVAQHIDSMKVGAFTYHDWDGLTLTAVPEVLRGQLLLTTVRGRAREAHLIDAFRKTEYPANKQADQITLTLGEDPSSTMTVQWRTDTTVNSTWLSYWRDRHPDTLMQQAEVSRLEDRLLVNDRYNYRFIASLADLLPGSTYRYQIHSESGPISRVFKFETAALEDTFSFHWFGDTHNDRAAGNLIKLAYKRDPLASFNLCSGDVVNTGLYRNDWDRFFYFAGDVFANQPLMAVPGNHDSQDGLGASMFQSLLEYPANGPDGLSTGLTYSFNYKNALFVMIDAASFSIADQTAWVKKTLASSAAVWKFVVVHFPPYNEVEPYTEIVNQWVPLFEQYGVDIVMGGHFHYYMRTHAMKGGSPDDGGIVYLMSVATSAAREAEQGQSFVAKRIEQGNFYQHFGIEGNRLTYRSFDAKGGERDRLILDK